MLLDDGYCYVCGEKNELGLNVRWTVTGDEAEGLFIPRREHQGWKDVVHGGILSALLDEAMARLAWVRHGAAVTAEMSVRFLAPAKTGERLLIRGRLTNTSRRMILAQAEISNPDGETIARAEGKIIKQKDPVC
ncbi:MAG: PaaI family thioesterase [Elusimicrobia bacterium]|nr:PaaI family thioesterase [Elusimicrobiota bacterium]